MDDVTKGTNTVFINPKSQSEEDKIIIMIGSRRGLGKSLYNPTVASFRAISFSSGKELWRLPIPVTRSYSRDVDGSALFIDGLVYLGLEAGYFYIIDPNKTSPWNGYKQPEVIHSQILYTDQDIAKHGGNLVTEASPALLNNKFYISSGSGHVFGLDKNTAKIVWDFYIGSDLDGTTIITKDNFLLTPVEKQYISGKGGVFKLDPKKNANEAVVWYFPVENHSFADWLGGVIGSVAVNDEYNKFNKNPALAAFNSIDGNVYLISQDNLAETKTFGPENKNKYSTPVLIWKKNIGGSISTPILVDDYLITAGYNNIIYIFKINYSSVDIQKTEGVILRKKDGTKVKVSVTEVDKFTEGGSYESTPIVWDGRIYIGSRDGNFYCLGQK